MASSATEFSGTAKKVSVDDRLPAVAGHGKLAIDSLTGTRTWAALCSAVLIAAYGPLVWQFFRNQWNRPQYQYFPFVIGAFLLLVWRNSAVGEEDAGSQRRLGRLGSITLLVTAWLLLGIAVRTYSPWLAIISAILLLGSRFLDLCRIWRVNYLFGIWAMLWLIVPLPLNRDQQLVSSLQRMSSRISSVLLDAVGVKHLMEGNALLLPGKQFFVDEACSGIVSVLAVIACAVIFGIWRNRPPIHVTMLAIAGVVWATAMNVMRISTIAFVYDKYGLDWSTGSVHEMLGLAIFALVFLALIVTDLLFVGLLEPIGPTLEKVVGTPSSFGQSFVRVWDRIFSPRPGRGGDQQYAPSGSLSADFARQCLAIPISPLIGFLLLALVPLVQARFDHTPTSSFSGNVQSLIDKAQSCGPEVLPASTGELRFVNFTPHTRDRNDLMGDFSRTYEYRDVSGTSYLVSCDFPYEEGWHELTICYRGLGWNLDHRRIVDESPDSKGLAWSTMKADLSKPDGLHGYLMANAFDEFGQPIQLPSLSLMHEAWRKLTDRHRPRVSHAAFQVQVWITSAKPLNDQKRDQAQGLLEVARQRFHERIITKVDADFKN